jgi:3-dehydroquinate synthase
MHMHQGQQHKQPDSISLMGSMIYFTDLPGLAGLLKKYGAGGEDAFFLADRNTAHHCLPLIRELTGGPDDKRLMVVDPGDDQKNIHNLHQVWRFLLHAGAGRHSRLFNLGGGMITDMGGFAASAYHRGIAFIHLPGSLTAMADAAIGGKTGLNLCGIKNQLGSFSLPEAVIICPAFLRTLPAGELLAGYAEVVKTALLADAELWEELSPGCKTRPVHEELLQTVDSQLLYRVAAIKAGIVEGDYHDHGLRQCLNFGHSIGHALEALYREQGKPLRHGIAVAAGMVCESIIANRLTLMKDEQLEEISACLLSLFPAVEFMPDDVDSLLAYMRHDKKNARHKKLFSLVTKPGHCLQGISCSDEHIRQALVLYLERVAGKTV